VQGDAALDQNRTREQIEAEIQAILDEAAAIDDEEDGGIRARKNTSKGQFRHSSNDRRLSRSNHAS
jgi:hypothetical protein